MANPLPAELIAVNDASAHVTLSCWLSGRVLGGLWRSLYRIRWLGGKPNDTEQQAGFRRLAVFRGGFRREAAQEAAGISLLTLSQLAQKSLVNLDKDGRFELHPLPKVFATEKLDEAPEERDEVRQRHWRYYARFLAERTRMSRAKGFVRSAKKSAGSMTM